MEMFPADVFRNVADVQPIYWDIALTIKDDAMSTWEDFCDGLMALRLIRMNEQKWIAYLANERDRFISWENPEWFLSNSP
jgi:hypothetical protein